MKIEGGEVPENIDEIIKKITPSITEGRSIDEVACVNAHAMVDEIRNDEIIKELNVKVVAAVYDIETGEVIWH